MLASLARRSARRLAPLRLAPQPASLLRLRCVPPVPAPCGAVACLAKQAKGGKGGKGGGKGKGKAAKVDDDDEDGGGDEGEAAYVEVDIEDVKRRMQGAVDALQREFSSISAGRTPTLTPDPGPSPSSAGRAPTRTPDPSPSRAALQP